MIWTDTLGIKRWVESSLFQVYIKDSGVIYNTEDKMNIKIRNKAWDNKQSGWYLIRGCPGCDTHYPVSGSFPSFEYVYEALQDRIK